VGAERGRRNGGSVLTVVEGGWDNLGRGRGGITLGCVFDGKWIMLGAGSPHTEKGSQR